MSWWWPNLGRNYSPLNKHIHKNVLVVVGDTLDLCEHYYPWVIFVHTMHNAQQTLNPLAALWLTAELGPFCILPGLSGGAWGNMSLLHSYLRIFQWRLRYPYGLKLRATARLLQPLTRHWDLFFWNSGTFLSTYVNLISDIPRRQVRRNCKPCVPNVFTNEFTVLRRVSQGNISNGKT